MKILKKLTLQHLTHKQLHSLALLSGGVALLIVIAVFMSGGGPFALNASVFKYTQLNPSTMGAGMSWAVQYAGMKSWTDANGDGAAQNADTSSNGWPAPRGCMININDSEDVCVIKDSTSDWRVFGVFSIYEGGNASNGKRAFFRGQTSKNRYNTENWNSTWSASKNEPSGSLTIDTNDTINIQWVCQNNQINYFMDECGLGGVKMCQATRAGHTRDVNPDPIQLFNGAEGEHFGTGGSREGNVSEIPAYGTTDYRLRCLSNSSSEGPWLSISVYNPPPTVSIAATDSAAGEPSSTGSYTLTRTGGTGKALNNVAFSVSGTATRNTDYSLSSGTGSTINFGVGVSSVVVTLTPINDSAVESNETATITLVDGTEYNLGTASASINISDDEVPSVSFTASTASVTEGGAALTFTVRRSAATAATLPVTIARSGTATYASDYTTSAGATTPFTVTIPANATDATFTLTNVNNTAAENTETAIFTISDTASYNVGATPTLTASIIDNDPPAVTIAPISPSATEGVGTTFTVTRSTISSAALPVTITRSGTATYTSDYTLSTGATTPFTVTIPANDADITFTLSTVDDTTNEDNETVILAVTDGANYNLGTTPTATASIVDNDTASVAFTAATASVTEGGAALTFTVRRSSAISTPLTVSIGRTGTATYSNDYTLSSGSANPFSVTIAANQTDATFTLSNVNDTADEPNETAILTIADSASYNPGTTPAVTATIVDNDEPICNNGIDDDGDGLVDLADPGCPTSSDTSENNIFICANGSDDDGDGLTDSADPGCSGSPTDNSELNPGISNFGANPARVQKNDPTTLQWTITNFEADACTITSNPSGFSYAIATPTQPGSGLSTSPFTISKTTVFTLSCGASGSQQKTVTVVPNVTEI